MPDKRSHRGQHPSDVKLFTAVAIDRLRSAVQDFSLLLTKGYAEKSSLKLVGDRFSLTERQRSAVMRCACSDGQLRLRSKSKVKVQNLTGQAIAIDGYNLLITIEAAMSGGLIFKGRDGCFKDLASIHGTYRKVNETIPAVLLIGEFLKGVNITETLWLLDSPVSNSGRLKTLIGKLADTNGWNWEIQLLTSPDTKLMKTDFIVASNDGAVLDRCKKWVNLAAEIIQQKIPQVQVLNLSTAI